MDKRKYFWWDESWDLVAYPRLGSSEWMSDRRLAIEDLFDSLRPAATAEEREVACRMIEDLFYYSEPQSDGMRRIYVQRKDVHSALRRLGHMSRKGMLTEYLQAI